MDADNEKNDLSRLRIAREPGRPGRRWVRLVVPAALLAAALLLWLIWPRPVQAPALSAAPQPSPAPALQAPPANAPVLNATGYVVAQRKAEVASKATGRIKKLHVREGDQVKSGAVIAELENDDLAALVKEREANIGVLQAQLEAARATLKAADLAYKRSLTLRLKDAVSQSAHELSEARYQRALADVSATEASLELARAQLDKARVDLSYTYILAPFDGTVLTKNADEGEIVAPFGSASNAKAAVVSLADMQSLQVEADVSEANFLKIHLGQPAAITLDSFPEKQYRGETVKIVPTVDRAKATVLVKIRFLDQDQRVIPEMSAKVAFALKPQP